MDVRCDRCSTEYEFDDTLVSERGTSVKCTNCGHQFKVYRARSVSLPDQWLVAPERGGRELAFGSLRDLQKAILGGQVTRADRLGRAGAPPRPLSQIPELAPFFDDAEKTRIATPAVRPRMPTPFGLGAPPATAQLLEKAETNGASVVVPLALRATMSERAVSMREIRDADPPTHPVPAGRDGDVDPPTRRRAVPAEAPEGLYTPGPPDSRSGSFPDDVVYSRPSRGGALRWVVAVVMLGTLGVLGATVGRTWLEEHGGGTRAVSTADPRVDDLLAQGERALADGDVEVAKEQLIRASTLAEKDKRVLVDLARLAAINADVAWLRLRLLPEGAADARAVAKRELADAAVRAKKAADRASEIAPDDASVVRAKIDALRLLDDRGVARSLAPRVVSTAQQPETAYVLAALDLGEPEPPWTTVLERLRLAASAETSPGRARAALAYALVRSGDRAGARIEIERIAAATRPSPLLPELRAFAVDTAGTLDAGVRDAAADAPPPARAVDVSALPAVGAAPAAGGPAAPARGGDDVGEFSERELQKRLFGDHHPVATGAAPPAPPSAKKAPSKPEVDTSDLPGVTPP